MSDFYHRHVGNLYGFGGLVLVETRHRGLLLIQQKLINL